jgi:malonyl CoA-acyl carrier protein transacylase
MSDSISKWQEMMDDMYGNPINHSYTYQESEEYKNALNGLDVIEPVDVSVDKASSRKGTPVYGGVLKYFPHAIRAVAKCSKAGNNQHHPDKPLHWDMDKSKDEYDALLRHLLDHEENPVDDDNVLHLTKVAWRALAGLERYLTGKLND